MKRKRPDPNYDTQAEREMDLTTSLERMLQSINVVSDEEAEKSDFVVCMPKGPSPFKDNFTGNCCQCGIEVMYRWHAPRRPKKICLDCAVKQIAKVDDVKGG